MADLGVSSAAIADVLRIATAGDYDQSIAKLNLAQRQVPIVVKLPAAARQDLGLLERLTVPGKNGPVMIGAVASLSHHRRPGRDRPLRPPAQHQFRDRTQRPAAGRSGKAGAGPAQPEEPAAGDPADHGGRCRGDGRAVRELRPGDADRRALHLRRAGAAVQGFRAAGDHPGRAGAVGAGRLPRPVRDRRRRCRCRR
jgi:hypothetical protein